MPTDPNARASAERLLLLRADALRRPLRKQGDRFPTLEPALHDGPRDQAIQALVEAGIRPTTAEVRR